jgi:Putative peptidoglycan binding domain/L,D-transpeptidase catalytic domain
MRYSVRRWLFCSGAAVAVGASAFAQVGPASAASATSAAPASKAAATAAVSQPSAYVPPTKNLRFGDHGPAVRSVQRRLNNLGYFAGPVDGKYGPDLEQAVWAFKGVQGLPIDARTNSLITTAFRKDLVNPKAPFSKYPKGGSGRIEINQNSQVLVLYRNNKPHLILHVSSGGRYYYPCAGDPAATCGPAITPDGSYKALSYLQGDIQVPLGFMENPVFFIGRAYAIHGGDPVPWYAASHGCVRIYADAVNWFHKRVHIGVTHIYVFGKAPQYPHAYR